MRWLSLAGVCGFVWFLLAGENPPPTSIENKQSKDIQFTPEQAKKVLKTAEEIRCLDKAEVDVTLTTKADNKTTVYTMKILRSTGRRAFIDFLAPIEERGRRMLALGNNYWSTFPDSKRVVSISRREMIGNSAFAIADIFQLDSEKDYDAKIVGRDKIKNVDILRLELKAKHSEAPYENVVYFVEESGYFPLMAKFYGASGKHQKTMSMEKRRMIAGRMRPETVKMKDEITEGKVSWWKTDEMKARDVPDSVFYKDYLKSLQ